VIDAGGAGRAGDQLVVFHQHQFGSECGRAPYRIAKKKRAVCWIGTSAAAWVVSALASTANNFARESFMDELAAAAGRIRWSFRLGASGGCAVKAVLEEAAEAV
jgi:isoquinoline 1-oxidoreductase